MTSAYLSLSRTNVASGTILIIPFAYSNYDNSVRSIAFTGVIFVNVTTAPLFKEMFQMIRIVFFFSNKLHINQLLIFPLTYKIKLHLKSRNQYAKKY
jgi:hypothetical protein